jgi:hypothetical protein
MGVGGQRQVPAALSPGKKAPVRIVQEAGPPGLVWTGAENRTPNGSRSPARPARNESLYLLRYPGNTTECQI